MTPGKYFFFIFTSEILKMSARLKYQQRIIFEIFHEHIDKKKNNFGTI